VDRQNKTGKTGCQDKTARAGQPGEDIKERTLISTIDTIIASPFPNFFFIADWLYQLFVGGILFIWTGRIFWLKALQPVLAT
jgi:hypothetical protein